ncbi:MAG: o-succinylbenzoate synthase, partial [Candidatus Sericytochromatia bacterium]
MSRVRFRVRPYDAPLTRPLETGAGAFNCRAGFYLAAKDDTGRRGLGEAAPLPAWGSESLEACREALAAIENASFEAAEALAATGLDRRRTPAAYAAAELALMDLRARQAGVSLATLRGGARRQSVPVNALIGAQAPEHAADEAREAIARGH